MIMNVNLKTRTAELNTTQKRPRKDLEYFNLISVHVRHSML